MIREWCCSSAGDRAQRTKQTMGTDKSNRVGLVISRTDPIRDFLSDASKDATLSDELQRTSSDLLLQSEIPYVPFRTVWMASDPSTRPDLTRLFSGTRFIFSSPKPREKVSTINPYSHSPLQFPSIMLFLLLQNLLIDSIMVWRVKNWRRGWKSWKT